MVIVMLLATLLASIDAALALSLFLYSAALVFSFLFEYFLSTAAKLIETKFEKKGEWEGKAKSVLKAVGLMRIWQLCAHSALNFQFKIYGSQFFCVFQSMARWSYVLPALARLIS